MKRAPLPIEDAAGWSEAPILIGRPPLPPVSGMRGPDGRFWELDVRGAKEREAQAAGSFARQSGREAALLRTAQGLCVVSRSPYAPPRAWEGIVPVGAWCDSSCSNAPRQLSLTVAWTHPQGDVERVTLWLRWRWCDPWTGGIYRCDTAADPFSFLHAPESPQLLPQGAPRPPVEGLDIAALFDARGAGYALAEQEAAQRALLVKAAEWLFDRGQNEAAWIVPPQPRE